MANQQFTVDGFPELFAAMDSIKDEIGKGKTDRLWRDVLTAAFQPVLSAAKSNAPHDTGQLAEHIYLKVHRPRKRDEKSKYWIPGEIYMARVSVSPLRDDSSLHHIVNKRGKLQTVWRNKKPVALAQEFGNANTPAHPFLRPALETNISQVLSIMQNKLKSVIEEVANKAKTR